MTAAVRRFLFENPSHFDPRDFLKPARAAAKKVCRERYLQFGCEGQAGKIKPSSLGDVAKAYASGKLAQTVV
jgi:fructose-bisphosphate aldolase class II